MSQTRFSDDPDEESESPESDKTLAIPVDATMHVSLGPGSGLMDDTLISADGTLGFNRPGDRIQAGDDSLSQALGSSSVIRYQIGAEIGRGGMGVVYEAWDAQLQRPVAIKVLPLESKNKPSVVQRFLGEAKITSRLQHSGIVCIHELGHLSDARPFFVMNLVRGETLQQLLADLHNPKNNFGRQLFIFEKICEAVAYAHARNVIHRDLKPSNIMVGDFGEVIVMDWGLAKILGEPELPSHSDEVQPLNAFNAETIGLKLTDSEHSRLETLIGTVFGTPSYLSPEQARGETDQIGQQSDVFGLGSMLCEILTGKAPYTGSSVISIFKKAVSGEIQDAMRRLDESPVPLELINIAKSCLAVNKADRPAHAGVVAQSISAYLQSEQRRAERDLVRFFDLSLDLFCIAGREGFFERINDNFSRLLGHTNEELTSTPFMDFVHPDDVQKTVQEVTKLLGGAPSIQFINRYRHKNGTYLWLEWVALAAPEEQAIYAVARDVTKRIEFEEEQKRSEQSRLLLAEVVNSAELAIISTDRQGRIQSWNPGAQKLLQYSAAEMAGKPLEFLTPSGLHDADLYHPGDSRAHKETQWLQKGGGLVSVSLTISPVKDDSGQVIGTSNIARDITEQKLQEAQIAKAHETSNLLASIVQSSDDAIISENFEGIIKSWNAGAERIFGYHESEILGQSILRIFPPDRLNEAKRIFDQLRTGKAIDHFETVRIHKDGRRIDVSVTISPIYNSRSQLIGISKVARDITETKIAQAKLEASRRELLDLAENANVALHWVDQNGLIIWANQAELDLLGYLKEEYIGQPITKFHAEADVISDILNRLGQRQTLAGYEARLIAKDGSIKCVSIHSSVFVENHEFKHTRCFTTDITARKQSEEALRISESRKQAMLNAGLDSIITIDHEGRIVDFNKAAEMKFGWSCDQVMGKIMSSVIIPPAYRDAHERGLRHYLRTGEGPVLGKRIQVEAMRSDGSIFPIEINICLIEIPNHPPQFTAFLRDLSESKS